jgi:FlaG/FlaF family flagellin (archaellin)
MEKNCKIHECNCGASAVIGVLLMFALTIVSISAMLVYSVPMISDLQDSAQAQKIEQGFTILDSRTSKVALGESPLQTTSVSLMGGSINVNDDTVDDKSSIRLVITNLTNPGSSEEFNCSFGTIEYTKDNRKIAYEGGGVWSKYEGSGGAVMISPPEFHYNGETLTLPIMSITGRSSSSGKGDTSIAVSSDNRPSILFPNTSISSSRTNPVTSDKVYIYIKSQYYDAWADYADTMIYTTATLDHENTTAIIELDVMPPMGTSTLTNMIKVGAVNTSSPLPIYNFSFDLEAENSNNNGLNPAKYEIGATSGTKTLTYSLAKKSGANQLEVHVTYKDTAAGTEYIEEWEGVTTYPVSGSKADQYATVDFLDPAFMMIYDPPGTDGASPDFSWNTSSPISELPDVEIYITNASFSMNDLTQHYLKLLTKDGAITFDIDGGKQDPVDYEESTITINYDGRPGAITYLHVTRNYLDVAIIN